MKIPLCILHFIAFSFLIFFPNFYLFSILFFFFFLLIGILKKEKNLFVFCWIYFSIFIIFFQNKYKITEDFQEILNRNNDLEKFYFKENFLLPSSFQLATASTIIIPVTSVLKDFLIPVYSNHSELELFYYCKHYLQKKCLQDLKTLLPKRFSKINSYEQKKLKMMEDKFVKEKLNKLDFNKIIKLSDQTISEIHWWFFLSLYLLSLIAIFIPNHFFEKYKVED